MYIRMLVCTKYAIAGSKLDTKVPIRPRQHWVIRLRQTHQTFKLIGARVYTSRSSIVLVRLAQHTAVQVMYTMLLGPVFKLA